MKIRPLSRDEVREVDRIAIDEYGLPGLVLMENAGCGAARVIDRVAPPGQICILCGKGNNGGDGYVIARHLELAGRDVVVVSIVDTDDLTGDVATNCDVACRSDLPICVAEDRDRVQRFVNGAECIVDCMLGTGASGDPRGVIADAVQIVNDLNATRIAVDVPTGVDCDTGRVSRTAFRADHTITFVAKKTGLLVDEAAQHVGKIHVVGIGAPHKLLMRFAS